MDVDQGNVSIWSVSGYSVTFWIPSLSISPGPLSRPLMAPSIYFCTFNLEACPVPQLLRTTKQSFSLSSALELAPFSFLHFTVNLNTLCFLSGFLHPQPFLISLQCNFLPAVSLKASHPHFISLNSQ